MDSYKCSWNFKNNWTMYEDSTSFESLNVYSLTNLFTLDVITPPSRDVGFNLIPTPSSLYRFQACETWEYNAIILKSPMNLLNFHNLFLSKSLYNLFLHIKIRISNVVKNLKTLWQMNSIKNYVVSIFLISNNKNTPKKT